MNGRKVMVVDDDRAVCDLVARTLKKAGFDVATALSGEEGLEQLATFEPACLVVDKVLPGLGGLEVMIEARRRLPGLPVVLITGHPEPFQLGEGRPDAVVLKPFASLKGLCDTVSAVLDSSGFDWPLAHLRQRVVKGMNVFDADAVFIPPGGAGALRFDDGTELFLDERSLVVIEHAPRGRRLTLRQGALSGRVGTNALSLETPAGHATIEAASDLRVVLGPSTAELTVRRGSASVGAGRQLVAGQRGAAGSRGLELLPPWPVELIAPEAQSRRVFTGSPGVVELQWAGALPRGARLQLAHDRLFAFVEKDVAVRGTTLAVARPTAGVTWWRLLDDRGVPLSEARRFVLVEDVPPVTMAPADGEVVMAPPGTWVTFGWTARADSERYRFELAASDAFEPVVLSQEVSPPTARLALGLAEGIWYWRVRSIDADEPRAASKASRFRLIHRAIPDAPVLLKPEIEVGE